MADLGDSGAKLALAELFARGVEHQVTKQEQTLRQEILRWTEARSTEPILCQVALQIGLKP
jgi:hypothetical protein